MSLCVAYALHMNRTCDLCPRICTLSPQICHGTMICGLRAHGAKTNQTDEGPQHNSCDQETTAQFFAWIRTTRSITHDLHLYSYSYSHLDHCLHAFVLILPGYGQPVRSVSPKPGRLPSPCGPQTPPVRTHQLPRPPESRSAGLTSCHSSVGML